MPRTAKIEPPQRTAHPDISGGAADAWSNGPDREEVLFMMGQFIAADLAVKATRDKRKRLRQQAKLRGFDLAPFDDAIAEREKEDSTTIETLATFKRYCEFMGLPVGSQMQLFDRPNGGGDSQQSLNERARTAGYELGIMGKNPDDQAWPPMSAEGQEHMQGWHEGQAVLLAKIGKLDTDIAAAAAKKSKKAGPEDENEDETAH